MLKQLDKFARNSDDVLTSMSGKAQRELLYIIGKARTTLHSELRELIGRLSLKPDAINIENDILRVQGRLGSIDTLMQKLIVTTGSAWSQITFPKVKKLSISDYNKFESIVGLPLSGFTKVDELQLRVTFESFRTILGDFPEQIKRNISTEFMGYIVAGTGSKKDLIDSIADMVPKEMSDGQVKNLVNGEMLKIYRTTQSVKTQEYENFRLVGPIDEKTSDICLEYVGRILSKEEWLDIAPDIFMEGLHFNCRHELYPIEREWLEEGEEQEAFDTGKRLLYSEKDREFIENSDVPNNFVGD